VLRPFKLFAAARRRFRSPAVCTKRRYAALQWRHMQRELAGLMLSQDTDESPEGALAHAVHFNRMMVPAASAEPDDVETSGQQRVEVRTSDLRRAADGDLQVGSPR
jgi:hypothetical protein